MLNPQERETAVAQFQNYPRQFIDFAVAKSSGHLIKQDQRRPASDRARDLESLAIEQSQLGTGDVREFFHATLLNCLSGSVLGLDASITACFLGGEKGVFKHRQTRERPRNLIGSRESQTRPPRRRLARHVVAIENNRSRVGPDVTAHHGEHGGFTGAVRSDHADDAAAFNTQIQVVGDDDRPEAFVETRDFKKRSIAQTVAPGMT